MRFKKRQRLISKDNGNISTSIIEIRSRNSEGVVDGNLDSDSDKKIENLFFLSNYHWA